MKTPDGIYKYLNKRSDRELKESMAKKESEREKLALDRMRYEMEKQEIPLYENQHIPDLKDSSIHKRN